MDRPPELPGLPPEPAEAKKMPAGAVKMPFVGGPNKTLLKKGPPPRAPGAAAGDQAAGLAVEQPARSPRPRSMEGSKDAAAALSGPAVLSQSSGTLSKSPRPELKSPRPSGEATKQQQHGAPPEGEAGAGAVGRGRGRGGAPGSVAAIKQQPARMDSSGTIRHSTTSAAARQAVAAKISNVLAVSKNKKTVQELLSMLAEGDFAGVNTYLNSLSKAERDETRAQLKQLGSV